MKKNIFPYTLAGVLIILIIIKNSLNHQLTLIQLSNDLFLCALPFFDYRTGFLWVFPRVSLIISTIHLFSPNKKPQEKPEFSSLSSASYGM